MPGGEINEERRPERLHIRQADRADSRGISSVVVRALRETNAREYAPEVIEEFFGRYRRTHDQSSRVGSDVGRRDHQNGKLASGTVRNVGFRPIRSQMTAARCSLTGNPAISHR